MSKATRFQTFLLLALAAAIAAPQALAAPPAKDAKEEKVAYAIVQVDDNYTVIRKPDLKDFQKGINDKYAADVKAHQQARKEAVKAKEKFTTPAPKKPKVKALPKSFNTEAEANEYVQQLKDAELKAKSAATPKTTAPPK